MVRKGVSAVDVSRKTFLATYPLLSGKRPGKYRCTIVMRSMCLFLIINWPVRIAVAAQNAVAGMLCDKQMGDA